MSNDQKTLLFIGPKNPVLEEIRPQLEGAEIYNILEITFKSHDSQEIVKLLPWVIIFTCAKECSKFMKAYGQAIEKTESKAILVTEKEASKKVLHANLRFKLSEYLYGNVQSKTLLHKIQLQVRSLPNISNKDLQTIATSPQQTKEKPKVDSVPSYEFGPSKKKGKVKITDVKGEDDNLLPSNDIEKGESTGPEAESEEKIKQMAQDISGILGVSISKLKIGKHLEEELNDALDQGQLDEFYEDNLAKVKKLEEVFDEFEVEFEDKTFLAQSNYLLNDLKESAMDIGFHELALFCELARAISLRLSVVEDESFGVMVIGILFNTTEFIKSELDQIRDRKGTALKDNPKKALFNRFHWINKKFESITAPPGQHFPNLEKIMSLLGI